jgi:hypothetical protein
MMVNAVSAAMARVASEVSLAMVMVYDRSYTNASTSTDKAKTETSNNHTLSMLPSVVVWTVKSLAVLQSGVTTLAQKYVPSEWKTSIMLQFSPNTDSESIANVPITYD